MKRALSFVAVMVCAQLSYAQINDTGFVYFAGNPANYQYTVTGSCEGLGLTATYVFLISGRLINSATGEATFNRWTSVPVDVCETMSFDTISLAISFVTGARRIYVKIVGDNNGIPNLNDVKFAGDYDVLFSQGNDIPLLTYYGGTASFLLQTTFSLGSRVTLNPGRYYFVVYGDDPDSIFESYLALSTGAPGGPRGYFTPRRLVTGLWDRWRFPLGAFTCSQALNTDLPWRSGDPNGNPADTSPLKWRTYHSPQLYHPVLGLRDSQAATGKVTGSASLSAWAGAGNPPVPTIEVILYKPGTNHRVARFSMAASAGTSRAIDTPNVKAGTYDVVVRPVYSPTIFAVNCPTDICIAGLSHDCTTWVGVRTPNVNVSGSVDVGTIELPNGDVTGDGTIDDADLLAVLFAFGSTEADCEDVNGDGTVDDADLLAVLFGFGAGGEQGQEDC